MQQDSMADSKGHQPEPHHNRTGLRRSGQDVGEAGHTFRAMAAPVVRFLYFLTVIETIALPVWVILTDPPPAYSTVAKRCTDTEVCLF